MFRGSGRNNVVQPISLKTRKGLMINANGRKINVVLHPGALVLPTIPSHYVPSLPTMLASAP